MRYFGTFLLLASVGMLLFPSFWEGRRLGEPEQARQADRSALPGRSTLTENDLLPPWRGPVRRGDEDG